MCDITLSFILMSMFNTLYDKSRTAKKMFLFKKKLYKLGMGGQINYNNEFERNQFQNL